MTSGNEGYCPLGTPSEMETYIGYRKKLAESTRCHTFDRENWYAHMECGHGKVDFDYTKEAIQEIFKYNHRELYQNNDYECLNGVHPDSWNSIERYFGYNIESDE